MFEELFAKKKINIKKLKEYGFEQVGNEYRRSCGIMDGEFFLSVIFDRHGNVDTSLTECDTGEEYSLYKTDAQGVFIGQVRDAISEVLRDISKKCFDSSLFKFEQTMHMIGYAFDIYGSAPEFLWKDSDSAILRRRDTDKWYAVIMTIPKYKLGIDSKQTVEVVNMHGISDNVAKLLQRENFYPAWHMNKKSWYTVILDGSVDNHELFELLDESYKLAKKK